MRVQIEGGHPLTGVYQTGASPNAAVTLMAAALLAEGPVLLRGVPETLSTQTLVEISRGLGATIEIAGADYTIASPQIARRTLTHEETDRSAGVLLLLGPILGRRGHARLEFDFPLNRIRTHLEAMRDLGIDVVTSRGAVDFRASRWEKRDILLSGASVTATALVMMLAASLGTETVIRNAACEPHLQELAALLTSMGARIDGAGANHLVVYGAELHGADARIGPHYVEAASIAAIAAMCGGRIEIAGVRQADLRMIARVYSRFGIQLDLDDHSLFVPRHDGLTISDREEDVDSSIESAPWPGFPSDLMAVATVIATQANGTTLIHEKMFANRLLFIDKLKAMGAQIVLCDPHRAIVVGPTRLHGTYMDTPDIRAGLGLVAAALAAPGISQIDNAQVLAHNFGDVFAKLRGLGAQIEAP